MSLNSVDEKKLKEFSDGAPNIQTLEAPTPAREVQDVFNDDEGHDLQYKTLSWQVRRRCS